MKRGVHEWLSEIESFGLRWERLIQEYEDGEMNMRRIIAWLDAAYERGMEDANKPDTVQ